MTAQTLRRLAMLAAGLATALTAQALATMPAQADTAPTALLSDTGPPVTTVASFTWRLDGVRADANGAVIETNYDFVNESKRSPVALNACGSSSVHGIKTYQWSFSNGDPTISTSSCMATWNRPVTQNYAQTDVTLTVIPNVGGSVSTRQTIRYRDRVIASLGDSAASGEGAPQSGNSMWAAHYCGRSGWAASAQAALRAQQALPDTTVHFWHLACAGARITAADKPPWASNPFDAGGMLDPFDGVYGNVNPPLRPQLTRLQQLEQQSGLGVDRLLLTIGANETEWAYVAEKCLPFVDETLQEVCLSGYASEVNHLISVLPAHFDKLANSITDALVPRDRIYLTGYFDPLDSLTSQPSSCWGEPVASQFLRYWAVRSVEDPLQNIVRAKARQYGWHYIDGIRQEFQGHGVCHEPRTRWINSVLDSENDQKDIYGTWHANRTGQLVIASTIYNAIAPHLGTPADDGEFVSYQGAVFRIAGGAPIYVSNWAAVGGSQPARVLDSQDWAELNKYPADGTLVSADGAVFRFAGGAPIYVSDWAAIGGPQPAVTVDRFTLEHGGGAWPLDHSHLYPADGTLVSADGAVFRFAGGAPIYVSDWAAIGGPQPAVTVDRFTLEHGGGAWPLDHSHLYPADGTLVSADGAVFRFAGGAPIYVSDWAAIGGPQPAVTVDRFTLEHGGGAWPLDHSHLYPADGTLVSADGAVFRFAGGAPIYVSDWAAIGGPQPAVTVDRFTLEHGGGAWPLDHSHLYPADGTLVSADGAVFRFAGGAPIYVSDWAAIGGPQPAVTVDRFTLEHGGGAWPLDHSHLYPADGTLVSADGAVFRFAGGAPIYVSDWAAIGGPQPAVTVDRFTLEHGGGAWPLDHSHLYPADGTLVSADGAVFRFAGGAPIYVSDWAAIGGPQPAVTVDRFTLEHGGGAWPLDHSHLYPADGTLVSADGAVFRFAGGAPIYVSDWAAIGGPQPAVTVDRFTLEHGGGAWPLDHSHLYPADRTFIRTSRGNIYRFAGDAALRVRTCSTLSGCPGQVLVDQASIDNAGQAGVWAHVASHPVNGTVIRTVPSGSYYEFNGGRCARTTATTSAVVVNDSSVSC